MKLSTQISIVRQIEERSQNHSFRSQLSSPRPRLAIPDSLPQRSAAVYNRRDLLPLIGVAVLYAGLMKLCLSHLWLILHGSMVWLPHALGVTAIILGGKKYWPAIFVGALLGDYVIGAPFLSTVNIALGALGGATSKTIAAVLTGVILQRLPGFNPKFTRVHDYLWLVLAGAGGSLVNAVGGAGSLWLAGMNQFPITLGNTMWEFWRADLLAILLFVPFLLVWRQPLLTQFSRTQKIEAIIAVVLSWLAGQIIFMGHEPAGVNPASFVYVPFGFVLWGGIRFGLHAALLLVAMFAAQTLLGSARELGSFHEHNPTAIWVFILTLSTTGISTSLLLQARNRAETERRKSNLLLETSQSIARLGGWELDLKTNDLYWTAETYRLHETSPAEFNPTVDAGLSFYPPESREKISAALDAASRHGRGFDLMLETYTTKGRLIHVRATCVVTIEHGKSIKLTGVFQDITHQKLAEEKLLESEERYRLLFDHNPLPMWLSDEKTLRFIAVNDTAIKTYGYTETEFLGLRILDLHPLKDWEDLQKRLLNPQVTKSGDHSWRHLCKDGSMLDVEVNVRRLTFLGRATRLVVAEDRTEKQLLQRRFLRAQRLESLGMLAAGIAHDFNNVLAPIGMTGELLRRNITAASDLRLLDTLEKSVNRGASLVRQILGFAHDLGGAHQSVAIAELLQELSNLARETFPKSITIDCNLPPDLWTISGSATQIHQIFLNLFVNARDAMPEGGTLRLAAENMSLDEADIHSILTTQPGLDAKPGNWVVLQVTDTGTGIPPEIVERIWEPFFTSKTKDKGTGLGLSTVQGIIATHHGFVTLQTAKDQGTSFRVYLPAENQAASSILVSGAPPTDSLRGNGELILVVDDEEPVRDIVEATLNAHGFKVITAADGEIAWNVFADRSADISLVVTDRDMPITAGDELTRRIRLTKPEMPVIEVSGSDSSSFTPPSKQTRFGDACLVKPFATEDLLQTIHNLLHDR